MRSILALILGFSFFLEANAEVKNPSNEEVNILFIGDSITEGKANTPGEPSFRRELYFKFVDANYKVNFVGSRRGVLNDMSPEPNDGWDLDHEGHWGWRADHILNGRDGQGKLSEWIKNYRQDVAIIHIGSNDMFRNFVNFGRSNSISSTIGELRQIVEILRGNNPDTVFFLAEIIPFAIEPITPIPLIRRFNTEVRRLASDLNSDSSPVIAVDHFTGFDTPLMTYDSAHPNVLGMTRIANTWFRAFSSFYSSRFEQDLPEQPEDRTLNPLERLLSMLNFLRTLLQTGLEEVGASGASSSEANIANTNTQLRDSLTKLAEMNFDKKDRGTQRIKRSLERDLSRFISRTTQSSQRSSTRKSRRLSRRSSSYTKRLIRKIDRHISRLELR